MKKLPLFPTLGQTLKKSLIELYSAMGFSLLISATWFVVYLPILLLIFSFLGSLNTAHGLVSFSVRNLFGLISLFLISFWNGLLIGPFTTAWYGLYQARKTDYPSFKLFFQIFQKVYWRSAAIHWVFSLIVSVLILNVTIAMRGSNLLLTISGIISAYVLLIVVLTSFYFHPLIYWIIHLKKWPKKSFLLVMDNIGLSIWLSAFLGLILLISISLVIPLLLIYGALMIYVIDKGFELIYQKYDD